MTNPLNYIIAATSNIPWIAVISILGGMSIAVIAIIGAFISAFRRQKLWHETARIALEKGQPLPPLSDEDKPKSERRNAGTDIRSGLILIAVGGGLYLFMGNVAGEKISHIGAIPGFIGVALLLFGLISALAQNKTPPANHQ